MKFFFGIVFLVALATLANTSSRTWGFRNAADQTLLRESVVRKAQKNIHWNINIDFPKFAQKNNKTISAVYVYDKFTNKSGGIPSLRTGGPGFTFASINLSSQIGKGMDSLVEIYGR